MKNNWFIGCFFILGSIIPVIGQRTWNLEQCIEYGWDNNLSIQTQELGVKIQQTNYLQANNNLLPAFSAQSSINKYFGRSIDPATNTYIDVQFFDNSYGLSSTIEVFSGFMKINTIAMERFTYEAEKNKLQQVKNMVALSIINGYFNQLLNEGLSAIALENYQLSREQYDYTSRLVQVGRKAGTDLLEIDASLAADSFLLVQSCHLLEQASLDLKYQMNYPLEDTLDIDTVLFSVFTGSMDTLTMEELFNLASEALPDMRMAENQVNAAKKAVKISKGSFSPRIGFYAGWGSNYATTLTDDNDQVIPFPDQISNNGSEYLSIGLDIPLFTRFSKYTALRKSKLLYEQARIQYDDEANKLRMAVEKSLTDWRSARAEYHSARKQLLQSEKAFEAAEKKLDKGLINIIEYYIQKNKVFRAKTEVLRTGLQALLKERYIRFLMTGSWIIEN
ncbi:MAG: TolC family protein [Bacteroidales bacterium]|nr:TolC family protein [Bacteroidales bacterium]